jgi:hypothetical protein
MHRGYHVLAVPTWERKLRAGFAVAVIGFSNDDPATTLWIVLNPAKLRGRRRR